MSNNVFLVTRLSFGRISVRVDFVFLLIMILGFLLRVKGILVQSFWLDEILSMLTISKSANLSQLLYVLKFEDQHPPFYFVVLKIWLNIFEGNDLSARLLSVIFGTLGIWATYLLGRVAMGQRTGLFAALLIAINPHHIYYSQEVRNYIFLYFFAALSFYFLFKLIKETSYKVSIGFSFSSLALIYTHYFGLFVLASQLLLLFAFFSSLLWEKRFKKIIPLVLSVLIITIGYLPWLEALKNLTGITSFWIPKPEKNFYIDIFQSFFSFPNLVFHLYIVLLCYFLFRMFNTKDEGSKDFFSSDLFISISLVFWFLLSLMIPYDRSLLSTPMLITRYTIGALPACILMVAISINFMKSNILQFFTLALVTGLTLNALYIENEFYTKPVKQQFREGSAYFQENYSGEPVIMNVNEVFGYYFKQQGFIPPLTYKSLNDTVQMKSVDVFWTVEGHFMNILPYPTEQELLKSYDKVQEFNGIGVWVKKFKRKSSLVLQGFEPS
jgi:mannosyltransferase